MNSIYRTLRKPFVGLMSAAVLALSCLPMAADAATKSTTTTFNSISPSTTLTNGDTATYRATVSPTAAPGQVSFCQSGSQECFGLAYTSRIGTVSSGIATYTQRVTVGTECLLAKYWGGTAGTTTYSPSQSASSLCKTVNKQNTSTVLSAERAQSVVGQTLNLSALVTCYSCTYQYGSAARSFVEFYDGTTLLGTVPHPGYAGADLDHATFSFSTTLSTVGTHNLKAVFRLAAAGNDSTSTVLPHSVSDGQPHASTTALTSNVSLAEIGKPVTLTASIGGTSPAGTVTFSNGPVVLGTAPVVSGAATLQTTFTAIGDHLLSANYGGDALNYNSAGSLTQTVVRRQSASQLTSSVRDVVPPGASVILTATVEGYSPSGLVIFTDGAASLGSASINAGQAVLNVALPTKTSHQISAAYAGDSNNSGSTSNAVTLLQLGVSSTPAAMTWRYAYDANGGLSVITDPNGRETAVVRDNLGQDTKTYFPAVAGGSPALVSKTFDGSGNVTSLQDPRGLATTTTFDGLSNAKSNRSPDTGSANATFDAAGNVLTMTDARGKVTTFTYDKLQRVKTVAYATGIGTTFEYDGGSTMVANSIGQLSKITDESGSTSYAHDNQGRVLTKTQVVGSGTAAKTLVVRYTYGATGSSANKLTSITYPSGAKANYLYDASGRLAGVTVNPVNSNGTGTNTAATMSVLTGTSYNGANALLGWAWGDGTQYQRSHDGFGRLSSYPLGKPNGVGVAAGLLRTLTYDGAGLITGYTHTNSGTAQSAFDQVFAYDELDRLTASSVGSASYSYGYDATGNRTMRRVGAASYANTIDSASNRLLQAQMPSGSSTTLNTYSHDSAGNVTSDGAATYAYSDRGRMKSATIGANVVSYLYNGLDQRVKKSGPTAVVPTGAAYFAYDEAGRLAGEYDANLVPIYETLYLDDMPVAVVQQTRSGSGKSLSVGTNLSFVYADHLNTPRVIVRNSDQAILWRWDSAEPFGATAPNQNPNALGAFVFNQRFPGQIHDTETGGFYNWHRDYKPPVGRYLQSDPIGLEGGINTYGYVGGNPISSIDPLGLANSGGWINPPQVSSGDCAKLREDIYRKNELLRKELAKYDPVADGMGGFAMKYGSGLTKPGGHYQEVRDLQRGLKRDLERYNKSCRCGDGDGNAPITRNVDELANSTVEEPWIPSPFSPFWTEGIGGGRGRAGAPAPGPRILRPVIVP